MTIKRPKRLSYSSLSTLMECGEKWRLQRGYNLDPSTWFATLAGNGLHDITEWEDLQEAGFDFTTDRDYLKVVNHAGLTPGDIPTFAQAFAYRLDDAAERDQVVKASGKVTKAIGKTGGPDKKNRDWYEHWGPLFLESWHEWKKKAGYTLATMPDGRPAVEVVLDEPIGNEPHKGFIDRVYFDKQFKVTIVDLKTGAEPSSKLQLGTYKVGLEREWGITAEFGAYWMASKGELSGPYDMEMYTGDYLDHLYDMAWRQIDAGIFLPNVSNMCGSCSVKRYCRVTGGDLSITIPTREVVVREDTEAQLDKAA